MNLGKQAKITSAITPTAGAAGTTDIEGTIFDMSGYDGVLAIVRMGVITGSAVTSAKWQQNTANSSSGMADLEGSGITIADDDDDQLFVLDLYRPQERYVRLYVDRATQNAVVSSAVYVGYNVRKLPIANSVTDLVTYELNISPAEGTA